MKPSDMFEGENSSLRQAFNGTQTTERLVEEFEKEFTTNAGCIHALASSKEGVVKIKDWLRTTLTILAAKEREAERRRIWSALCDLAEPDERQPGEGELHTHLDDVHEIINKKPDYELPELYPWKDSFNKLTPQTDVTRSHNACSPHSGYCQSGHTRGAGGRGVTDVTK